ncbi:hypothetical protein A3Q56_06387, partial [Intoshia linei]
MINDMNRIESICEKWIADNLQSLTLTNSKYKKFVNSCIGIILKENKFKLNPKIVSTIVMNHPSMKNENVISIGMKHSKLIHFLKNHMNPESFQRSHAFEACLVCSPKRDKDFMYTFVDDEFIYLTENPPKSICPFISFGQVSSINLVIYDKNYIIGYTSFVINEYPSFLSGSERENTVHIRIKYKKKPKELTKMTLFENFEHLSDIDPKPPRQSNMFNQVKQRILSVKIDGSLRSLYDTFFDIKLLIQQNYIFKHLFWNNIECFKSLIYILKSFFWEENNFNDDEIYDIGEDDEIEEMENKKSTIFAYRMEIIVQLVEILSTLLFDTYHIPSRQFCLRSPETEELFNILMKIAFTIPNVGKHCKFNHFIVFHSIPISCY